MEYMNLYQAGFTLSQIATHYGVNRSTVSRVLARARKLTCPFSGVCDQCPLPECAFKPEYAAMMNGKIPAPHKGRQKKEKPEPPQSIIEEPISEPKPEPPKTEPIVVHKQPDDLPKKPTQSTVSVKKDLPPQPKVVKLPPVERPLDRPRPSPTVTWKQPEDPTRIKLGDPVKVNHRKFMMTDGEIRTSFRQARDQIEQITILAQLNGTDERTIKKILGID